MLIGKINNFIPFKGFDYSFDKPAVPERQVYDEELGKPNVFRDEELFDEEEDVIDAGYQIYDYDDLPVFCPNQGKVPDCLTYFNNMDTSNICGVSVIKKSDYQILNEKPDVLFEACRLKKPYKKGETKKTVFSHPLYDRLMNLKKKSGYSYGELAEIADASKLRRNDKSQYADLDLLDAVVFCKEKFPQDYKKVVKSLVVKDVNNNQLFLKDVFDKVKHSDIDGYAFFINAINKEYDKFDKPDVLKSACVIELPHSGQTVFVQALYDELSPLKYEEGYSYTELADIAKLSILTRRNKTQHVDFELLDAVLYCKDRFPDDYRNVINQFIVKSSGKNRVFLKDKFEAAKNAGTL